MSLSAATAKLLLRIETLPGFMRAALAFAAGGAMVPAMPPWGLWPLLILGFTLFVPVLASAKSFWRAFGLGWLFGFGFFVFGLSWIANALLVDGNDFKWVWPLAIAGLPAGLAFFTAFACAAAWRFSDLKSVRGLIFLCAALGITEFLRGHIFTGFPWNLFAYAWANTLPMAQGVSLVGSYGLTLFTMLWCITLPAWFWSRPTSRHHIALTAFTILSMAGFYIYGHAHLKTPQTAAPQVHLRVVQPNISQADKWDPDLAGANLRKLLDASAPPPQENENSKTIIVWPETALTDFMLMHQSVRDELAFILKLYRGDVTLAAGQLRMKAEEDGSRTYYNSVVFYNKAMDVTGVYDKAHLVPFGEYIPFQKYIPIAPLVAFSGFQTGKGVDSLPVSIGDTSLNISPLVCYEVIFPGAVIARDKDRPALMVNVTNDAWYGDSAGPRQHLAITRYRAIEEGIPAARSANTGISAIIDAHGRIAWQADLNTENSSYHPVPAIIKPTIYGKLGDVGFIIMVCIAGVVGLRTSVRKHLAG